MVDNGENTTLGGLAQNSHPVDIDSFLHRMGPPPPPAAPPGLEFTEMQVTKLDVKPGHVLAVTFKTDDMDSYTFDSLSKNLKKSFPDNKVLVFVVGLNDGVLFTQINENKEVSSCNTGSYCIDCNCGKKEQYEGKENV